jgi:pimeloyl-ACP methyl ester carboxylesterase
MNRRVEVTHHVIADVEITLRRAGDAPIFYLHGVPNSGEMWEPFLERTGGIAPDLPGFGESGKPARFKYSIEGYADFLAELTAGVERFSLVMHDWGSGAGLALAQRRPEAVDKIVLLDAVPLLPGYRWHRIARIWRTPVAGELFMGFSSEWIFRLLARRETSLPREVVDAQVAQAWKHFDHGTQRAILKLYRSAPVKVLEQAGKELGSIGADSYVVWGEHDPYLPTRFAEDYASALGGRAEIVPGAGHWPWLDDPGVIDRVAKFLAG